MTAINEHMLHYRIVKPLGEGGMGQVYLAEDTRLERHVALKVMADALRDDSRQLERFKTEARAAASLNHAHIATIYAVEETDEGLFITMEYVEGETLSALIRVGGVSMDRFFSWFLPLADALYHAHDHMRIHRDLKPGNIMVSTEGQPKILDFGLARIVDDVEAIPGNSDATTQTLIAPTLTEGIVGTPAYMSPEQAQGRPLDHRSDIFSMGVIMYQAVTGTRPFSGDNPVAQIVNIMKDDPPSITLTRPDVPYHLWRIIKKCLQKNVRNRYQSMLDVYNDLAELKSDLDSGTLMPESTEIIDGIQNTSRTAGRRRIFFYGMSMIGIACIALWFGWFLHGENRPTLPDSIRQFHLPVATAFDVDDELAISPDGGVIAFTNRGRLWIRRMDTIEEEEIPDTIGARRPFWSPDGKYIGFVVSGKPAMLRRVAVDGGAVFTICEAPGLSYATWSSDGFIIVSTAGILSRVSEQGGELEKILNPDPEKNEDAFEYPHMLPDGKSLLFAVYKDGFNTTQLVVQSDDQRYVLLESEGNSSIFAQYSATGHLLYGIGSSASTEIWGVPFSPEDFVFTGDRRLIISEGFNPSVSREGTLVYKSNAGSFYQLNWVNRDGGGLELFGQPQADIYDLALMPEDNQAAIIGYVNGGLNIYLQDETGVKRRFTFDAEGEGALAVSASGDKIAYSAKSEIDNGALDIFVKPTNDLAEAVPVVSGPFNADRPAWSADDRYLMYQLEHPQSQYDLWYVDTAQNNRPTPFLESPFNEIMPVFSPDGKYVAYASDRTGRYEIFVRTFPDAKGLWQISEGLLPRWSMGGDEMFFVKQNVLMVATTHATDRFRWDPPRKVFSGNQIGALLHLDSNRYMNGYLYDISSKADRILTVQPVSRVQMGIRIVQHWPALLEK